MLFNKSISSFYNFYVFQLLQIVVTCMISSFYILFTAGANCTVYLLQCMTVALQTRL